MNSKWKQERVPTGRLALVILNSMGGQFPSRWEDKPDQNLEEVLSEAIVGFAVAGNILHRASVKRAEEERRRHEQEMERLRLREEIEAVERRKKELKQRAEEWRQAAGIRAYVQAARDCAELESKEFEEWALWALQYADELDSIISNRATNLEYRDPDLDRDRPYANPSFSGWRHWRTKIVVA